MNIAMLLSGGVDSAVALHRLIENGHTVTPFYIRIGMDGDGGGCSAEEDIEICTFICRKYGLQLEVVTLHDEYWENVMEYALDAVKRGLTPNPDMMCNRVIKFGYFERWWGNEFDSTATGHYATKLIGDDGLFYLGTAPDPVKDQTDFLARITYSQLKHVLFPIGDIPKNRVRALAVELALPNAYRRDSQGICFLGKINYNDFLLKHLGERPGSIIELETGKCLGKHRGYWFHTIGQRKGLGLSGGPWFVVRKNINDNIIYVSRGYDTDKQYGTVLPLVDMHWITKNPWPDDCLDIEIQFKNRHTPEFIRGHLSRLDDTEMTDEYRIISEMPVQGIAPGQFAVVYTPDKRICLGSGMITGNAVS